MYETQTVKDACKKACEAKKGGLFRLYYLGQEPFIVFMYSSHFPYNDLDNQYNGSPFAVKIRKLLIAT